MPVVCLMASGFFSLFLAILPLAMDTFAVAAVVGGTSRLTGWARWRISAVFVVFEGGMPLVGLALGTSLGHALGDTADYLSGGLLIALAGYLRWADRNDDNDDDDDDGEVAKARRLSSARGLALVGLALSISLDEWAIGLGLGLGSHHGPTLFPPALIIAAIAVQTLIVSQLGLSLGSRVSNRLRERIEGLTSPGLACLGGYQLTGTLMTAGLLTALEIAIGATLILIPATAIMLRRPTQRRSHPVTQAPSPHLRSITAPLRQAGQSRADITSVSDRPHVPVRAVTASGASPSTGS
ncbi:MAG: manganese efflux pump [Pseudonocardiales bacterium]|nr:manganese efflux pump [Pseudonocardiales bacterium]